MARISLEQCVMTLCIWTSLNFIMIYSKENYRVDGNENLEFCSEDTSPPHCPNDIISLIQTTNKYSSKSAHSAKKPLTESNKLSIKPTPTFTTEYIIAAEYTPSTTAEVYSTITTVNSTFRKISKIMTETTTIPATIEHINKTTPPEQIQSTETISDLHTNSMPALTSTVIQKIVASPITEHTGITHTKTVPVSITTTLTPDIIDPSNMSVVASTVTPSLPNNVSTIVIM